MKKLKMLPILTLLVLTSCSSNGHGNKGNLFDSLFSNNNSQNVAQSSNSNYYFDSVTNKPVYTKIDIDLTTMNSTMVYSQVYNMLNESSSYIGKIVKMAGPFKPFYDEYDTSLVYPAIVIQDATACCATGVEFLLYGVPLCTRYGGDGYPNYEEEATIVGRFETYLEGSSMFVHLVDSIWVK